MPDPSFSPSMSRKIFELGLPVETVSAYLLCCALAQEGQPAGRQNLLAVWNAAPAALDEALSELQARNILARQETGTIDGPEYRPQPATAWRGT